MSGYRLLIKGESGRGKTRLTSIVARILAETLSPSEITVVDFAPNVKGLGSPVTRVEGVRYLRPEGLRAPRLESGGDCRLAWKLALHNASLTSETLISYISDPTPVLLVNDATIHLHAGSPETLLRALELSRISILNAYSGDMLRDRCGIWEREAFMVSLLERWVDEVWSL